jgi:solute carrier family 12 sodium/potassium/chloride transporter 2
LFEGPAVDRTIDVYWLFDEGGLTVLLPYLLTLRQYWSKAKIRVFTAGKQSDLDQSKLNLSALLNKFRIESSDIIIISDLQNKPSSDGVDKFNELVSPFLVDTAEKTRLCDISEEDIENFKKKTNRQIRINEIIKKHSSKSDLIVVTLPIVKQTKEVSDGLCPAALYLAWLETITRDLPPTLLLRGNQESVLTFYS